MMLTFITGRSCQCSTDSVAIHVVLYLSVFMISPFDAQPGEPEIIATTIDARQPTEGEISYGRQPTEEEISYGPKITVGIHKENNLQWTGNTIEEALTFQYNYCSMFCADKKGFVLMDDKSYCLRAQCTFCSCDRPMCQLYGICCPDIEEFETPDAEQGSHDEGRENGSSSPNSQVSEFPPEGTAAVTGSIVTSCEGNSLVIRRCPPGYPEGEARRKCEQEPAYKDLTLETFTRVIDLDTNVTYFNAYCAECHGVKKTLDWDVSIECVTPQWVYQATDESTFFKLSVQPHSTCGVYQSRPPQFDPGPICLEWWFHDVIDSCNVTGEWNEHNSQVQWLCENIVGLTYRLLDDRKQTFANIFCFLCNSPDMSKHFGDDVCSFPDIGYGMTGETVSAGLPFSVLLGTAKGGKLVPSVESFKQVDLNCSPGKVIDNSTCVTSLDRIRGLAYKSFVFYTPVPKYASNNYTKTAFSLTYQDAEFLFSLFALNIQMMIDQIAFSFYTNFYANTGVIYVPTNDPHQNNTSFMPVFYINATFQTASFYSRDKIESMLLSTLYSEIALEPNIFDISFDLKPFTVDFFSHHHNCKNGTWSPIKLPCHERHFAIPYFPTFQYSELIPLTPLLICPFVTFNNTEYSLVRHSSVMSTIANVTLQVYGQSVELSDAEDDMNLVSEDIANRQLRVCHSLLEGKIDASAAAKTVAHISARTTFLGILSLTCLSLSMLCLVLTLLTYSLFPSLRSVAGINNMFLSASLLMAQAFLLATAYLLQTNPLCKAVGITTHFMWLSMFCWSFTCCFHMFQIFTSKTRSAILTERAKMVRTLRKALFCAGAPILVILVVVATSLANSEWKYFGYGRFSCYLDTQTLIIAAVVAPLCVMVVSNLVFFAVTVYKIHNIRKLQSNMDLNSNTPKDIYVYVKLSSMTGCFWALAIIAEYLDNFPLRIVAIVLNGLQGVFIFWSYICNKRVLHLYLKALGVPGYTEEITRTGTITRVARDAERIENKQQ
ncbi:G-protein coupled receptor mth [Plakobranchus ocellatus]|uniref:G-protein coupled receptor mth n=1 Tax=Plakobranchus ocellatus TaxID=259542 RepID=A0AAV4A6Y1_9GAST|nr:G-protein coupled receptor mth [Plakobranchus ocellatus]